MMQNLQIRKINIINSLMMIENESTIHNVEEFFRSNNLECKSFETDEKELLYRAEIANLDISMQRLTSHEDLKNIISSW